MMTLCFLHPDIGCTQEDTGLRLSVVSVTVYTKG